jgi:hypothetical protein
LLCHPNPFLHHPQGPMTGLSGTGNSSLCGTGLRADGRFRYLIESLFLDVCPEISVKQI